MGISSTRVSTDVSDRLFVQYRDEVLKLEIGAIGMHALASLLGPATSQLRRYGAVEDPSISRLVLEKLQDIARMRIGSNTIPTRRFLWLTFEPIKADELQPDANAAPDNINKHLRIEAE